MPNSMTGFGGAEGPVGGGRLRVEIRTVNHRYFHLTPKLPADLSGLEGELRERLRREFDRGHVALQARWTETPERSGAFAVDLDRDTRPQRLSEFFGKVRSLIRIEFA